MKPTKLQIVQAIDPTNAPGNQQMQANRYNRATLLNMANARGIFFNKYGEIDLTVSLDAFTRAYIECALWSSNDESDESGGDPLDQNYSTEDIHPDTLRKIIADCDKFKRECDAEIVLSNMRPSQWSVDEIAGHDFWLTRNGHGAGFWDGDWSEPAASKLTAVSKTFGECDLYVGDDKRLHI